MEYNTQLKYEEILTRHHTYMLTLDMFTKKNWGIIMN